MNNLVLLSLMYLLSSPGAAQWPHSVIMPAVHFVYAGPGEWDFYDYEQPIRVEINPADVAALSHPRVRLFAARYVKEADEPVKLTIKQVNGCGIFQSRPIGFVPTVSQPWILLGRLDKTDFRCVANRIMDTDFYLVVEQGGASDSVVRVNLDAVDDYFEYAYRFTVTAPPSEPCNTGTEVADKEDERERQRNHKRYMAARRRSEVEQQKLAAADTKMSCIDTVKESEAALLSLGVAVSMASNSEGVCCAPKDQ